MVNQRELTDDGFEKNFATNTLGTVNYGCTLIIIFPATLGTYLLTTGLIPALEKSSDARVVSLIHPFPIPSFCHSPRLQSRLVEC